MRSTWLRVPLLSAVVLCAAPACAARAPTRQRAQVQEQHEDRELLTQAQLLEHHFSTAYEAVSSLRGYWLETHGVDSLRRPSQVWVYLNDTKLGGVETLQTIAVMGVLYIRHIDGLTATGRWGLDHGQGVILVSTR